MKRSYPYTGPAAQPAGQQPGASTTGGVGAAVQTPDYSAYGYGPTTSQNAGAAGTNNDAQQAQWHQQWQQYYAQQAATAAAATQPSPVVQQRPQQAPQPVHQLHQQHPQAAQQQQQQQPYVQMGPQPLQQYPRPPAPQQYVAPQQQQYAGPSVPHQAPHPHPQQQQRQQQSPFYGQFAPQQQPQQPAPAYPTWPQQPMAAGQQQQMAPVQGYATPHQQQPIPQHGAQLGPAGPQQPQGFYGNTAAMGMSPGGPAPKRQRLENGGMQPHAGMGYGHASPGPAHPSAPQYGAPHMGGGGPGGQHAMSPVGGPRQSAPGWGQGAGRQQNMPPSGRNSNRAASGGSRNVPVPHAGGPSNMAGPMASNAKLQGISNTPRPFGTSRPARNQGQNQQASGRSQQGSQQASSSSKFTGPVGVNAIGPASGSTRGGYGQRVQQSNKLPQPPARAAAQIGGAAKGGRQESSKGAVGSKGRDIAAPKGPAAGLRVSDSAFDLQKPAFTQGRTSTAADQPVPISSKRTFTDFKIKAVTIDALDWHWAQHEEEDDTDGAVVKKDENASTQDGESEENARDAKRLRSSRRRNETAKDISRLRLCFAANPPPVGAPTGPKALVKAKDDDGNSVASKKANGAGDAPEKTNETSLSTAGEGSEANASSTADQLKQEDTSSEPDWTAFSRGPPQSSTNRISISYASTRRRLVIDAESIKKVSINREESFVDIVVEVTTAPNVKRKDQQEKKKGEEWVIVKGVLLEARDSDADNFAAVPRRELEDAWREQRTSRSTASEDDADVKVKDEEAEPAPPASDATANETGHKETTMAEEDVQKEETQASETQVDEGSKGASTTAGRTEDYQSLPPFYRLLAEHNGPATDVQHSARGLEEIVIRVAVEDAAQGAKWVRTGDVAEWLAVLPGIQPSLASDPVRAWIEKIRVADPEAPPTLTDVYNEWSRVSVVGQQRDRQHFLQENHLESAAGLSELFARLVRGDRHMNTPPSKELGAALQEAASASLFEGSQSFLSLSVLALLNILRSYSSQAIEDGDAVEQRLQDLVLCLPLHLTFRALDSLCKEALDKQMLRATHEKGPRNMAIPHTSAVKRPAPDSAAASISASREGSADPPRGPDAGILPTDTPGHASEQAASAAEAANAAVASGDDTVESVSGAAPAGDSDEDAEGEEYEATNDEEGGPVNLHMEGAGKASIPTNGGDSTLLAADVSDPSGIGAAGIDEFLSSVVRDGQLAPTEPLAPDHTAASGEATEDEGTQEAEPRSEAPASGEVDGTPAGALQPDTGISASDEATS